MTSIWREASFVVAVLIPHAMAVPRALTRALLCYMLYSRAAEQNNLVCLNEYSTSNVTLGALRKIIGKKKISLSKPNATKASRKWLVTLFGPSCQTCYRQQN